MLHDEDDDLCGLWMFRDGVLTEVGIPGTQRVHTATSPGDANPGFLVRTGLGGGEDRHSPEHVQDPWSCW
ncbi:hypothetical protein AB0P41_35880 [Streptomyces sp. NPDC079167]|uniref:hypothetical protein n=1 Tax=Streptomyces sp. NPDC079167 TaxID=3154513 RepID=UPI003428E89F